MKTTKLLTATLFACLPAMAQAQGWYAGMDVGAAHTDVQIEEHFLFGTTTDRDSGSSTAIRLRGGYQFGRFFALELAYIDVGEFENHFDPDECPNGAPGPCSLDARTSVSGFIGSVAGILPMGEHWYLDARMGIGNIKVKTQALGGSELSSDTVSDGLHYGIGGGYRFNDHWDVRVDYSAFDQMDFDEKLSGPFGVYNLGETTMTSFGVNYRW